MHSEFTVHVLDSRGLDKAQEIAVAFDDLLTTLEKFCPPGRELAIVKTKLEEACFFAKKSMASAHGKDQALTPGAA